MGDVTRWNNSTVLPGPCDPCGKLQPVCLEGDVLHLTWQLHCFLHTSKLVPVIGDLTSWQNSTVYPCGPMQELVHTYVVPDYGNSTATSSISTGSGVDSRSCPDAG
ncbi:hypothetical protein V1264_006319 [Littorina saxatilis]|uniref:Uncharacterized protein n=1 Tax=Littorina saxatilis TaxID=31220 RepID=A0AAN9G4S7_9CAEN